MVRFCKGGPVQGNNSNAAKILGSHSGSQVGSAEVKLRSPAIYLVIAVHGRGGRFAAVDLEEPVHDQVLLSERRPRQRDVPLSQRRTPAVEAELRHRPRSACHAHRFCLGWSR